MRKLESVLVVAASFLIGLSAVGCTTDKHEIKEAGNSVTNEPELLPVNRVTAPDSSLTGRYISGGIDGYVSNDYTFDLAYTFRTGEATSSVADSAPGEAQIVWNWEGTFLASNTTEGRNSSWGHLSGITAHALWPYDSLLCSEIGTVRNSIFGTATDIAEVAIDGVTYCGVKLSGLSSSNELAIGATKWSDLSGQGSYTVSEASAAEVLAQLGAGPEQVVLSGGTNAPCTTNYAQNIFWSSNESSSCISRGGYVNVATSDALDVPSAMTVVDKYNNDVSPTECPISVRPQALSAGLMGDSFQTWEWSSTSGSGPLSDDAFDYHGFSCSNGGMMVELLNASAIEDINIFLANDMYASWPEVSEDISMHDGTLVVGRDSITPESGDTYDIVRYAWTKDDLLVNGRIVRGTPEQAVDWVELHLPQLLTLS